MIKCALIVCHRLSFANYSQVNTVFALADKMLRCVVTISPFFNQTHLFFIDILPFHFIWFFPVQWIHFNLFGSVIGSFQAKIRNWCLIVSISMQAQKKHFIGQLYNRFWLSEIAFPFFRVCAKHPCECDWWTWNGNSMFTCILIDCMQTANRSHRYFFRFQPACTFISFNCVLECEQLQ